MRFKSKSLVLIISLILIMTLSACSANDDGEGTEAVEDPENKVIEMGQISWAENIAVTNMWKVILEEHGYEVKFNLLDMGTMMAALANQELDVSLEVWLPVQDANYLEQYREQVNFSEETWYDEAKVGLVVPAYMDEINSIEDLNEHQELFAGQITGFDPGAGTMEVTEDVIDEYGLNFELLTSSEPAMITEIQEAMKQEEPIVAPLWSPHRVFSELDLKYLEDPKEVYGAVEKIHHATRHGFEDDFSEVDHWFKNWKMSDKEIGELMNYVEEADEPIEGASKWVDENQDLIDEWLK